MYMHKGFKMYSYTYIYYAHVSMSLVVDIEYINYVYRGQPSFLVENLVYRVLYI